jgi:hypothetical protein
MKNIFVGEWTLVEMSLRDGDEAIEYPNGRDAKGRLIYTEGGLITAQIGNPDRKRCVDPDYRNPTESELSELYPQYISYFGRYEVIEERGVVVHDIEMSLFPNWIGTKVKRYYSFSGNNDTLELKATPIRHNGKLAEPLLRWKRE